MSMLLVGFRTSAVNFKVRTLLALFGQVISKHLRMKTSINLESLTKMPTQEKKNRYIDSLKTSSSSSIITKSIKMHDATIQKL